MRTPRPHRVLLVDHISSLADRDRCSCVVDTRGYSLPALVGLGRESVPNRHGSLGRAEFSRRVEVRAVNYVSHLATEARITSHVLLSMLFVTPLACVAVAVARVRRLRLRIIPGSSTSPLSFRLKLPCHHLAPSYIRSPVDCRGLSLDPVLLALTHDLLVG